MKPYKDTFLNRNTRIRRFKQSVSSKELVWHRDRSDRVVKIVEGSGWQLQMDNGLPEKLVAGKEYYIPANNYHRLIKGKTDLVAEIKEDKMKITRRQLKRIIKEAIISENIGAKPELASIGKRITQAIPGSEMIRAYQSRDLNPGDVDYQEDITIDFNVPGAEYGDGLFATFEYTDVRDESSQEAWDSRATNGLYSYTFWSHDPNQGGHPLKESPGLYDDPNELYDIFVQHAKKIIEKYREDPSIGEYPRR